MTRKDYQLLAKRLNELCDDLNDDNGQNNNLIFSRFMSRLCADLKEDNPNFDSAKFRDVVYDNWDGNGN